jgi:hypothetical protein
VSIDFDEELAADIVGDLEGPIIDFWTPGRIAAYLDRINRRMLAFDRRMMRSQAGARAAGAICRHRSSTGAEATRAPNG